MFSSSPQNEFDFGCQQTKSVDVFPTQQHCALFVVFHFGSHGIEGTRFYDCN
uniref:Uncharacterized protein n=1 Tax=Rhizophora mucronata TaxID=61149 RepID=A0A2P2PJN3_RHIMU